MVVKVLLSKCDIMYIKPRGVYLYLIPRLLVGLGMHEMNIVEFDSKSSIFEYCNWDSKLGGCLIYLYSI